MDHRSQPTKERRHIEYYFQQSARGSPTIHAVLRHQTSEYVFSRKLRIRQERIVASGHDATGADTSDPMQRQTANRPRQNDVSMPQRGEGTWLDLDHVAAPDRRIHTVAFRAEPSALTRSQELAQRRLERVHAALRMQSMTVRSGTNRSARTGTSATSRSRIPSVAASASAS